MRLEVERRAAALNPTEARVRSAIMSLRSYGPSSFASLTDEKGNYLQVAGGGVTCMLEKRVAPGHHFRGYKDERSKVFPDGTVLQFGGGQIRLAADEWFTAQEVADVFCAFLRSDELPVSVKWRDVTSSLSSDS